MCVGIHVNYLLRLSVFNETGIFSTRLALGHTHKLLVATSPLGVVTNTDMPCQQCWYFDDTSSAVEGI
jgi:hypothetical protein